MNVLVTGGSGLVGSQIEIGMKPTSKELNLLDFESTRRFIIDNEIESVIHCAARVGGVKENLNKPVDFLRDNLLMNLNLFEACRDSKVKKIVSVLSTCIFPADAKYPLTPEQIHLGEPHHSNYGYAYGKRMMEVMGRAYSDQHGIKTVSVVPCNIYGPNDNFNLESSHVIPALVHKMYLAKRKGDDLSVWGTGKAEREFLFSRDVGRILEWCLHNYEEQTPLIISPDEEISIRKLVDLIQKEVDFTGDVVYTNELDGQMRKPSDNTMFKKLCPDFEFTPIEEGIRETAKWFQENYESCRR